MARQAKSAYEKSCVDAGQSADAEILSTLARAMDLAKVTHIESGLLRALITKKDADVMKKDLNGVFLEMVRSKVAHASVHPALLSKAQRVTKA